MTDKNLASLPPIELIGMLNISRARFSRSKDNHERVRLFEQQIEIVRAMRTIQDALQYQIDQLGNSEKRPLRRSFFWDSGGKHAKKFFEQVLDKTESRHYNFLPINGLFVIKFRLWRACASRETCNRFQIENQIQIQFSNLKSFSD